MIWLFIILQATDPALTNRYWIIGVGTVLLLLGIWNRRVVLERLRFWKSPEESYTDLKKRLALTEYGIVSMIYIDVNSTILVANQVTTNMFGWSMNELIGANLEILMPEGNRQAHRDGMRFWKLMRKGSILNKTIHVEGLTKAGDKFPVELTVQLVEDNGKDYFIGSMRDMTMEFERLHKINEEITFHRTVEEIVQMGSFRWNFLTDRVKMTKQLLDIFDLTEEDNNCLSGETLSRIITEDIKHVGEVITDAIENGKQGYYLSFRLKNGYLINLAAKIIRDSKGVTTEVIGALRRVPDGE